MKILHIVAEESSSVLWCIKVGRNEWGLYKSILLHNKK